MMKRIGNPIILVNFEGRRVMQLIASSTFCNPLQRN